MAMLNNQMVTQYIMVIFELQDGTLRHNPSGMRVPWRMLFFFGLDEWSKNARDGCFDVFFGEKKHDTD